MRKLTAREINEIAEIFKATLDAYTSKTSKVKTAGTSVEVDGQETDLASLPIGTAIACDGGQAYKTSQGWTGTAIPGYFQDDEEAAAELAEESSVEFLYGPSSSPVASVTRTRTSGSTPLPRMSSSTSVKPHLFSTPVIRPVVL